MFALTTYDQTGVYDPTNPDQRIREVYASSPGKWASFYWNKVPTTSSLRGLGAGTWSSLPAIAQIGIVAAVGGAVGYFGWKRYGATLKPKLQKVPIVGSMLSGPRRRR